MFINFNFPIHQFHWFGIMVLENGR
jgi:hypothetical protein